MAKTNFALFTCDSYKSKESRRYIGTATSLSKVKTAVKSLLKNDVIENNSGIEVKDMELRDLQELDYFLVVEVQNNVFELDGGYYA